jgi:hypothetical protein
LCNLSQALQSTSFSLHIQKLDLINKIMTNSLAFLYSWLIGQRRVWAQCLLKSTQLYQVSKEMEVFQVRSTLLLVEVGMCAEGGWNI